MSTIKTNIETKKQLVPALRFKEFDGGIAEQMFENIFLFSTGKNIKQAEASPEFETPCVRYGELYHMYGEVIKEVINKTNLDTTELLFSKGDEILLPSAGEDPLDIGSASALTLENVAIGRTINILRPQEENNYSQIFASYYINEKLRKKISTLARGASISNVYNSDLKKLKINLPSLPEQQKIASFLSAVDEKIQQLTKKKELLEQYKKGVMQQLFSGELRFKDENGNSYPDWEEKRLGEIIDICSSKRVLQEDWKEEGVPFLRTREIINLSNNVGFRTPIFISETLFQELKLKYGVPKSGDVLVTGVGTIGKLYVVKESDKFYFKDGNVIWFKMNDTLDSDFINQLFNSKFIRKQLTDNASITTVATFTIDGARKTKIIYPCIKEQQKVATYLSSIDIKIESIKNQITQTQIFKKGLLQQMFV